MSLTHTVVLFLFPLSCKTTFSFVLLIPSSIITQCFALKFFLVDCSLPKASSAPGCVEFSSFQLLPFPLSCMYLVLLLIFCYIKFKLFHFHFRSFIRKLVLQMFVFNCSKVCALIKSTKNLRFGLTIILFVNILRYRFSKRRLV